MYHSEAIKIRTSSFQRALVKDLYLVYPRMLKTGSGELLPLQQFPPRMAAPAFPCQPMDSPRWWHSLWALWMHGHLQFASDQAVGELLLT